MVRLTDITMYVTIAYGYTHDVEASQACGTQTSGREAQKRRTRAAIVAATRQLVSEGKTPSIDDIAEAADVSRRTIYLYFPTLDQLVLDASCPGCSAKRLSMPRSTPSGTATTPWLAPMRSSARFVHTADDALPFGPQDHSIDSGHAPSVVDRRQRAAAIGASKWIDRAVEPLRSRLTDEQHERLVSGARSRARLGSDDRAPRRARPRRRTGGSGDALGGAAALVEAMISEAGSAR